ncbi:MAG: acetate/propionate family kinase [Thermoleophilia bacterium]
MRVLVVNTGSSSLKLRALGPGDEVLASDEREVPTGRGERGLAEAVEGFLAAAPAVDAVGHRVVHGGPRLTAAARLGPDTEDALDEATELAPLHNPRALAAARAVAALRPDLPAVLCFDTAFHATIPPAARTYALPAAWHERWGLRRYGFHGLSHAYVARRVAELVGRSGDPRLRVVSAHLGAGASLAAIVGGRSVDTTMGLTPMEGLVMATRSGSVDPGLVLWVQRSGGIDAAEAERALSADAGLLGLSGRSADMRDVLAGAGEGDARCALALDVYVHRLAGEIARMATALGGIDVLAFTGGVGENADQVRRLACDRLALLGVPAPLEAESPEPDRLISPPGAAVAVAVIAAREDLEVARQVRELLGR